MANAEPTEAGSPVSAAPIKAPAYLLRLEMFLNKVLHADGKHGLQDVLVARGPRPVEELGEGGGRSEDVVLDQACGLLPEPVPGGISLGVFGRDRCDLADHPVRVPPEVDVGAVRVGQEPDGVEGDDVKAVVAELQVVDDLGLEHVTVVGAGGEPVAGNELLGSASAADNVPAFENEDAEAGAGKVSSAGEAVVAPTDDYGVMGGSGHFFFLDLGPKGSGRKGPSRASKEAFQAAGGLCVPESLSMAAVGAVCHAGEGRIDLHRSAESHSLHTHPGDCLVDSNRGLGDQGYALGEGPGHGVKVSLGDYLA